MADVLICGAGPAGAIAAVVLARAGAQVLVLDRARFPRSKLCGDTVNPGAIAVLRRLDLDTVVSTGLPVCGMIVTGERDVRVEGRYGAGVIGRSLKRSVLDTALIAAAERAGAQIDQGVLVREPIVDNALVRGVEIAGRDGRSVQIRAAVTIAADGGQSRLARALGLAHNAPAPRRWAVGAYFEGVQGITACGEMHVRAGRYIGLAPLPGGVTNVCVVTANRDALRHPMLLMERTLGEDPQLARRFAAARMIDIPVCLGPMAVEASACGIPGLLLAGDAAGFIDPITGDGLRFAFRGGELAALAALDTLADGRPGHPRLAAARRREFAGKWRFNRTIRRLIDSRAAVQAATFGATAAPVLLEAVIRYAGDVQAS